MSCDGQKRKLGSSSNLTPEFGERREEQRDTNSQVLQVTKKSKRQKTGQKGLESMPNEHPAATFKTPSHLQATLDGLPAELRLQIYDFLCDSTIIHVHRHCNELTDEVRFTWTPCRSPNPTSPLLCANPKWSGMCKEKDRCTYKIDRPPELRGFWALAASSKLIRNEAQEYFFRKTVVSIHPSHVDAWLRHLAECRPGQISHLRRITLAGVHDDSVVGERIFQVLRDQIPNLEGLGYQCQDFVSQWGGRTFGHHELAVDDQAWKRWRVLEFMRMFDRSVTIATEAMIWSRSTSQYNNSKVTERQAVIRVLREGKLVEEPDKPSPSGWSEDDVKIEIDRPGKLVVSGKNANWRRWWQTAEARKLGI